MQLLRTHIGRLRVVGILEAVSYLALLGIAMPLKYLADMPLAVRIVGSVHGFLFVVLCIVLLQAALEVGWSFKRAAGIFVAALLPFGPFIIDRRLAREDAERRESTDG